MSQSQSLFSHRMAKWGLFVALLFAVWFGGWFAFAGYLDGRIKTQIDRLADRGVEITCNGQDVVGFPFRIGVECAKTRVAVERSNVTVEGGQLRTTAVVHDPTRMIAELQSPLIVRRGRAEVLGDWQAMRLFVNGDLSGGFERISLDGAKTKISTGDGSVSFDAGALHLRPTPDDARSLDLAVSAESLAANPAPAVSIPPVDIAVDLRLDDAYGQMIANRGSLQSYLSNNASVLLRSLVLSTPAGGRLALSGPMQLNGDGTVSGEVSIGTANPNAVGAWAGAINPGLQQAVAGIGQAVAGMGSPARFGAEELPSVKVTIERNVVKLGFITLTTLPKFGR